MIKVTVEVEGTQTQVHSDSVGPLLPAQPRDTAVKPSVDVVAKAVATGAINAGTAPALDAVQDAAPLAASVAGGRGAALHLSATSAGPAPRHPVKVQP
jgi:hypothetical protein